MARAEERKQKGKDKNKNPNYNKYLCTKTELVMVLTIDKQVETTHPPKSMTNMKAKTKQMIGKLFMFSLTNYET